MSTINQFTPAQELWLCELESGRHAQGTGKLFRPSTGGYCCLGIAARFALGIEPVIKESPSCEADAEFCGSLVSLKQYRDLYLYERDGRILYDNGAFAKAIQAAGYIGNPLTNLAGYNDGGATFAQIAAAIRAVPWAVFDNFAIPATKTTTPTQL